MAEEEDFAPYKDISELKKELEGMKGKKDISSKELYDAVQKLAQTIEDMLDVFGAAAEQMKLEEKELESEAKKHEMIIAKLDKLIEQNKVIAEGMVAIVEMVKEKIVGHAKEREESIFKPKEEAFKPKPEPMPYMETEWPKPEMPKPQFTQVQQPMMPPPDLGMPPLEPTPADLDLEEPFPLGEEPKKKGLFGMFKKQ